MTPGSRPSSDPAGLAPLGEMGRAIAAHPWAATSLGPVEAWPAHLSTTVRLMLEAGAPMALVWGKDHRVLYNDPYARIIQDKHPSALGRKGIEVFPEIWNILQPLFLKAMAGQAVLIEDFEMMLTRRGRTKPSYFSFSYNPVRGPSGVVEGFLAVVIETTARVVQEQERAQVFDTVLSSIADFAYTFDLEGRFLYINRALLALWGLPLSQAIGKNFFELNYPADLAGRLQDQIQKVIRERAVVRDETLYVSPTGEEGYYEYIFSPVFSADGAVTVVAGSTRDITARKKLELAATAAAQAKDDFIAALSHELRTPLNPVLLLATTAAENPRLPDEVRADFRSIAENVVQEARLIDDLLDISRITHGKLALDLAAVDLAELLEKVIASVQNDLRAQNVTLVREYAAGRPLVHGDGFRLRQVFGNILRNAIKFTAAGGRIGVALAVDPAKPGSVAVRIADTGIGLTPGDAAKIFRPFVQGDHVGQQGRQAEGLGLGLAIAQKIVELHAGSIAVESRGANCGATFVVELPLVPAATGAAPLASPAAAAPAAPALTGVRILLVEDHESSRMALARILRTRKIEVTEADSATQALEAAQNGKFDFVISDIGLPDGDGRELMRILKATYGCEGIALSGYGTQDDIALSRAAGFRLHLTKPVQTQVMLDALAQLLRR